MKTNLSSAWSRFWGPFLAVVLLLIIQNSYGQATFTSIASGSWDGGVTTWSITGTDADNIPDADDDVIIAAGHTITVDQPSFASTLTLNSTGGSRTLTLNADLTVTGDVLIDQTGVDATTNQIDVGSYSFIIGGNLTINGGNVTRKGILTIGSGSVDVAANLTLDTDADAEVTFSGNGTLEIGGVFTRGTGSTFNVGTGTVEFDGGAQTIPGINYYNLVLAGSGAKTLSTVTGTWTLGGSLTFLGTASASTVDDVSITDNLNIGDGTSFTLTGFNVTVNGTTNIGGGTSGTLTISTSTAGAKIFAGLVTLAAGATWNNTINDGVTFRGGITKNASATFNAGTTAQTFNTNDQALTGTFTIASITVTGITLTNDNTLTVGTALSGTGTLLQGSGAVLNIGGTSGITNIDAVTNTNTVNYTGTAQTIKSVNYSNLSFSGSGAKTLGTGTVSISSNLTLSGTVSTTTVVGLSIGGNLDIGNNTTFNAAGFNLTVNGTTTVGAGTSGTLNITSTAGTKTFSGLVTINSGGTWNCSVNEAIAFENGLTFNGATFVAGSGQYSFNTNPQSITGSLSIPNLLVNAITLTNNGTITVGTNLTITGSWVQGAGTSLSIGGTHLISSLDATAAGNTVHYTGGTQNVFPTAYNNLTINQSAGQATLTGNTSVNGTLTLTLGNLNLGGYNLTLGASSPAIAGAPFTAAKMIIATGGDEVVKTFNSTGSYFFPIGENTGTIEYSPVTVNVTSGSGFPADVSVSVVDAKHPNNASTSNFISRYWNVTQAGITNCIATISGEYVNADINGVEGNTSGAQLNGTFNQVSN
ncbi:MAG TPA: hypothetical protein VFU05_10075, partial [Cyclobacteriaceae bacterium]|nr:hypothetical protein [Cyclobacteriaceae bacterium]